jgi:hypothetical protein
MGERIEINIKVLIWIMKQKDIGILHAHQKANINNIIILKN